MNVALWPLIMNVVRAKAASPSGAGSAAAGVDSTTTRVGATSAAIAMSPPLAAFHRTRLQREPICIGYPPGSFRNLRRQLVGVVRQILGSVRCDEHEVLEPDAAVAR